MRRSPTAPSTAPPTTHPWTAPRPGTARARPIVYRPHPPVDRPAASPRPLVATWLTPDERLRVDAAGQDAWRATHFDALAPLARALATQPFDAALVSVALLVRGGREAGEALAALLRTAPALPTAALVSEPVDLAAVLALGRAGMRAVVDVRRPDGWTALRVVVARTARPDVARLAARTLGPALAPLTPDVQRFVAALFEAPAGVITVRDLARGLGVLPTTLMSRFFRAALPPPKRYLAYARLTRAAHLLRTSGWTVAAVADHLEYSSAQGFSRHLHLLFGIRPAEFRRRYDADAMLARFGDELLRPYDAVLRTFRPLRADPGDDPGSDPGTGDAMHRPVDDGAPLPAAPLPGTAPGG
jgi:AraC-like DNA-binding protein